MTRFKKLFVTYFFGILFLLSFPLPTDADILPKLGKQEIYVLFFALPDGEATLIQTEEANILLNTGSSKSEEKLLNLLEELSIGKIDKLILTKQTADYCGNAERIIERYQVDTTILTGELSDTCLNQIYNSSIEKWSTNTVKDVANNLTFKVLMAKPTGEMTLDITYGQTSILYSSNGKVEDEEVILKHQLDPEILKIADYAQGNSPSSFFLSRLDPHMSIVFQCEKCDINEGMIERLNESWVDVYDLQHVGTTILRINLDDYEIIS